MFGEGGFDVGGVCGGGGIVDGGVYVVVVGKR